MGQTVYQLISEVWTAHCTQWMVGQWEILRLLLIKWGFCSFSPILCELSTKNEQYLAHLWMPITSLIPNIFPWFFFITHLSLHFRPMGISHRSYFRFLFGVVVSPCQTYSRYSHLLDRAVLFYSHKISFIIWFLQMWKCSTKESYVSLLIPVFVIHK